MPGNNVEVIQNLPTILECWQKCRENDDCKSFTHAWATDLSLNGNCMIKGKSQEGDDYKRESFIMRFNMGQNMYIGRGIIIKQFFQYVTYLNSL